MKTGEDIKKAVGNIQYYAKTIGDLTRKQMAEDIKLGNELGVNVNAGTSRFDSLGAIGSASNWIETHCLNILSNITNAEALDKELYKPDEQEPF